MDALARVQALDGSDSALTKSIIPEQLGHGVRRKVFDFGLRRMVTASFGHPALTQMVFLGILAQAAALHNPRASLIEHKTAYNDVSVMLFVCKTISAPVRAIRGPIRAMKAAARWLDRPVCLVFDGDHHAPVHRGQPGELVNARAIVVRGAMHQKQLQALPMVTATHVRVETGWFAHQPSWLSLLSSDWLPSLAAFEIDNTNDVCVRGMNWTDA